MEDFPILLAKILGKGVQPQQPTQNLQMMRAEAHKEDPKVNIMLQSGATTGKDNGKQPKEGERVSKVPEKEIRFYL